MNLVKIYKKRFLFFLVILIGFLLRIYLTRFGNFGDVNAFAEWGKRFWELNPKDFYFDKNWYYTFPTYPPISMFMLGFLYWVYDKRYILAEIHNATKLVPSAFILYFNTPVPKDPFLNTFGYYLLLKLPAIIADIFLSILIYNIVLTLTRNKKKAIFSFLFYILSPVSLFISGVWGQTESLVSLFGLVSFLLLLNRRFSISLLSMFLSLYLKPTWVVFLPLYLAIIFYNRRELTKIFIGILICLGMFFISTFPFSGKDIWGFSKKVVYENFSPEAKGDTKTSTSLFNFYSIFLPIDKVLSSDKIFKTISFNDLSLIFYVLINLIALNILRKEKEISLATLVKLIFIVGFGTPLFLVGMLERYLFIGFLPMIILGFMTPKTLKYVAVINTIFFLNLIWSYFRRSSSEVDLLFTGNNFLLIRLFSLINTLFYLFWLKKIFLEKKSWRLTFKTLI